MELRAKKYVLTNAFTLTLEESILKEEELQPDQVLAETVYTAISPGTELAAYRGDPPLRPMKVYPRVLGYCNVARIKACGNQVKKYCPGDLVLTFQCHCSAFIAKEDEIIMKVEEEHGRISSITYLYHLGYNALLNGEVRPGMNVAIVGLGTLGLTSAWLAAESGCSVFAFTDQVQMKDFLASTDISHVFSKSADSKELISEATCGTGIDLVINTSNTWDDWRLSLDIVRKKGRICVLGFPGRGQTQPEFNPLDSRYFYDKQLTIIACGYTTELHVPVEDVRFNIERNMRFLNKAIIGGKLNSENLVSETVRWDELETIYKKINRRPELYFTALLEW